LFYSETRNYRNRARDVRIAICICKNQWSDHKIETTREIYKQMWRFFLSIVRAPHASLKWIISEMYRKRIRQHSKNIISISKYSATKHVLFVLQNKIKCPLQLFLSNYFQIFINISSQKAPEIDDCILISEIPNFMSLEIFQEQNYDVRSLDVLHEINTCIRSEKYYTRYIEAYAIYRISRG
jgi:hypothetical protein